MIHIFSGKTFKAAFFVGTLDILAACIQFYLKTNKDPAPVFLAPSYDEEKGIPFIHPVKDYLPADLHGYAVKPQALNEQSLRLFCAIELPHPKKEIHWEKEKSYDSIADLYDALKMGILILWDECYVGNEYNTKQKNAFNEYHNTNEKHHGFSQNVHSVETAFKAIDGIIEQVEGADSIHVPADFRPHQIAEEMEYETAWYRPGLSHYQKFRILLHTHHKLPEVYQENKDAKDFTALQDMKKKFAEFLGELEINFKNDGPGMPDPSWKKMFAMGDAIAAVWESGICPDFTFS
jgi:hypothetical protein